MNELLPVTLWEHPMIDMVCRLLWADEGSSFGRLSVIALVAWRLAPYPFTYNWPKTQLSLCVVIGGAGSHLPPDHAFARPLPQNPIKKCTCHLLFFPTVIIINYICYICYVVMIIIVMVNPKLSSIMDLV